MKTECSVEERVAWEWDVLFDRIKSLLPGRRLDPIVKHGNLRLETHSCLSVACL